jgi:hypothetical protein
MTVAKTPIMRPTGALFKKEDCEKKLPPSLPRRSNEAAVRKLREHIKK